MSVLAILRGDRPAPTVNGQMMHDLLGISLRAYGLDGEELGELHLPDPVLVGDIAAFEQGPAHEIVSVLHDKHGQPIAAKLRLVRFHPARR